MKTTMKKTIIALAAAAAIFFGALPAHAVNLLDDGDTRIDLYSRLYLMYENTDSGTITGNSSRVGLRTSHRVHDGLSVFARAEFRYDASERTGTDVFNDRRNTYVGIDSSLGRLTVGNFDSVYFQSVSHLFDIYENEGFVALGTGGTASRGNSVAYSSPGIHGFQLHGQVKHYDEDDSDSGDEEFVFQLAGTYEIDRLSLGFGAIVENDDAEARFAETLYGFSAQYKLLDTLDILFLAEHLKDAGTEDYHFAVGAIYDYGAGDLYASVGRDANDDTYFGLGANYKFSDPMRVFVEYGNGDSIDPDDIVTAGLRYDF